MPQHQASYNKNERHEKKEMPKVKPREPLELNNIKRAPSRRRPRQEIETIETEPTPRIKHKPKVNTFMVFEAQEMPQNLRISKPKKSVNIQPPKEDISMERQVVQEEVKLVTPKAKPNL